MKAKTILLLILMSVARLGHAHNPQLATFYLRPLEALWVIEGSFAQYGLHEAMKKHYTYIDLDNVEPAEYKKLTVAYVKSHISIETKSGRTITLGEGGLRLGNHQTDIRFILTNLPEASENLNVRITCLSENEHHTNILRAPVADGGQFILNADNRFTAELDFGVEPVEQIASDNSLAWILGGLTLVVMTTWIVFMLRSKRKELLVNI